jgi:hypothetical protein
MRTTLTLDPDVARLVEAEVHRARKPMKQIVNDALRRGLSGGSRPARRKPYRLQPHVASLLPGIDRTRLNALADELEDAERLGRLRPRKKPATR